MTALGEIAVLLRQLQAYQQAGEGDPDGVRDGPRGAVYHRTDGTAGTLLYVKDSDVGILTGWTAFA